MGPKYSSNSNKEKSKKCFNPVSKNYFEFLYVIGKGGFGKVWKVILKKNKTEYALKEMAKVKIIDRKSERSIMYERDLLSKLKNNFIVNMHFAFQDYDNLYLIMDLLNGGDLRYHVSRYKKFTELQTTCIVHGLEYIHSNNIIHRDIKPENLVLDDKGYLRITDFGVAKNYQKENSSETSGTPGYMAPEVMCGQNHSYPVDYFAVGVLAYEFMLGVRPYLGKSRKEIKEMILSRQAQIKPTDLPYEWSEESADFINKLLQRKPSQRLGYNGISEIKEHSWLKDYPWQNLIDRKIEAPFVPKNGDNFDKRYCEGIDKLEAETLERYHKYYKSQEYSSLFRNYTFFSHEFKANTRASSKTTIERMNDTNRNTQSINQTNKFLNVTKRNGRNESATSVKISSISPIRAYGNSVVQNISNKKILRENKSFIINKSVLKLYTNTAIQSHRDGSKIIEKLPTIDLTKLNTNKLMKSTSVSNIKNTKKYSTSSMDSHSTMNSLNAVYKRGNSLAVSKKKLK